MTGELNPALRELLDLVNAHGTPAQIRALAELINGRDAVLKMHHSTPVMFVVGSRRESRDCCAECEEGTYWPCLTAALLDMKP